MMFAASGASDHGVWESMDADFHGGSNETISGRVGLRQLEISLIQLKGVQVASESSGLCWVSLDTSLLAVDIPPIHNGSPISLHLCHHMRLHTLTSTGGDRGMIKSCHLFLAVALSSHGDMIRVVFSQPMSPSLVCWISPTAMRKKVTL